MSSDKQNLAAVITEMVSPLESTEVLHSKSEDSINSWPPAYGTVDDTVVKRPVSEGDVTDAHSTEKKFTDNSSESDDSRSDTDTEPKYTIQDMTDLMRQIDSLQKEQEELRLKQQIHEQHIKELLDKEPCVHRRFKSWRKSISTKTETKLINDLKQQQFILTEEHIYVQLEQLYANFHVLHFPSKTAQNILGDHKHNNCCDTYSVSESMCLRNKHDIMCELESEQHAPGTEKTLSSPQREGSRLGDIKSPAVSNQIFLPGRPTSPLPLPPMDKDLCPVEVTFKWTISNYSKKLRQSKVDESHKEISCPFYLTHCGYRVQIEAYLNGNGTGHNKCMSVFLRIVKGDYDRHLKWPVNLHLVVILVNHSGDHSDSLKAEGNQFEYNKPSGSSDDESDCWGLIEFVSHEMIKQRQYITDDKIELKCRAQLI